MLTYQCTIKRILAANLMMANMLSKSELKELKTLHQKKYRILRKEYLVEGDKLVCEAIDSSAQVVSVFCLASWSGIQDAESKGIKLVIIDARQLDQLCELKNPNQCAALVKYPNQSSETIDLKGQWSIFLDRLRDPGNLGTIMRIADWYGINHVFCSEGSVEQYNQKVVQASMGAIFRVKITYIQQDKFLALMRDQEVAGYAAVMNGKSIHSFSAPSEGVLLMGNEAQGLDSDLIQSAGTKISIPGNGGAESLNVGVATGILADWASRN